MKPIKLFFLTLFLYAVLINTFVVEAQVTMRAAIDFGSGAIKIQMAEVNTEENCLVSEIFLAKYVPLGLIEDVAAHEGCISEKMQQKALFILDAFKKEALKIAAEKGHAEVEFAAIATAVFRKAQNGNTLLQQCYEKTGIQFQILSQVEEGQLGFLTAKALYPHLPEASLCAWDSGNGSFQITTKEAADYQIYQGPLGHGTVRVLLSTEIRKQAVLHTHESGNPILKAEALELIQKIKESLPPTPEWLKEKLKKHETCIVTFGDGESIFALVSQAFAYFNGVQEPIQQALISVWDVEKVINQWMEQKDETFIANDLHIKTLTSAVHLLATMEYFGIQKIHYKRSLGNTSGMLIHSQLWTKIYVT